MKNVFLALILITATIANAQPNQERLQKRASEDRPAKEWRGEQPQFSNAEEMAKVLEIDQATANKAWTIYSEYKDSKKALMEPMRNDRKEMQARGEKMTDADYEKAYRTRLDIQRKRLSMDETYYNRFLEIMPASKVHTLLMTNKHMYKKPDQQRTRTGRE